jgi:hypothetical protein
MVEAVREGKKMEKKHLFDDRRNVKRLLAVFFGACVLLLLSEFFLDKSHSLFAWERWPEFYAVYGFVGCVLLVLVSKYVLRPLVMRDEDHYE